MARILITDDDVILAGMLQKVLTAYGHEVAHAGNGHEALRLYDPQLFHLVLTDLDMPGMGGVELIGALRLAHPAVKVIAMSGGGGAITAEDGLSIARQAGALRTLTKPFPLPELLDAVKECLAAS